MNAAAPRLVRNGEAVTLGDIPTLNPADFREHVLQACESGARLAALFGQPAAGEEVRLVAVLARDGEGQLALCSTAVTERYPALTPDCTQAHWFEREIAEQWGVRPEGHPWLKPIRFHPSYRAGHDAWDRAAQAPIEPSRDGFLPR